MLRNIFLNLLLIPTFNSKTKSLIINYLKIIKSQHMFYYVAIYCLCVKYIYIPIYVHIQLEYIFNSQKESMIKVVLIPSSHHLSYVDKKTEVQRAEKFRNFPKVNYPGSLVPIMLLTTALTLQYFPWIHQHSEIIHIAN